MHQRMIVVLIAALMAQATTTWARTITVTPGDDFTAIEAAEPGDIVEIAPGTYQFRVMLDKEASASNPIVIRAQDPTNRPVWDLAGQLVSEWPGSYTAGDRGRGCWQVKGSHYEISGIVFRNCQDSSSAGLRAINCGKLTIRDCLFEGNTNGLTGSSSDLTVEFSEFRDNGKTDSGNPSHNIYIYGGNFTLRYSHLHHPREGQNFHVRAAEALLESNFIAHAASYPGDVMTCESLCGGTGSEPITQTMRLHGNVIVQDDPSNKGQIFALYADSSSGSGDGTGKVSKMRLEFVNNTIIGTPRDAGASHVVVNMRNDTVDTEAHFLNNIIFGMGRLAEAREASLGNWQVTGATNWISSGTEGASDLSGSIQGADPGFVNATGRDFHLDGNSPCVGKASPTNVITTEYYQSESDGLRYRQRVTVDDLGAFEAGNAAPPIGPYQGPPPPLADSGVPHADAGAPTFDGGSTPADASAPAVDSGVSPKASDDGCGCAATPAEGAGLWLLALLAVALFRLGRRAAR